MTITALKHLLHPSRRWDLTQACWETVSNQETNPWRPSIWKRHLVKGKGLLFTCDHISGYKYPFISTYENTNNIPFIEYAEPIKQLLAGLDIEMEKLLPQPNFSISDLEDAERLIRVLNGQAL